MQDRDDFWDTLGTPELDLSARAVDALRSIAWARPLLDHARKRGSLPEQVRQRKGWSVENASDLFELRFAYELHRAGRFADYEFAAGVGDSTIDFRVSGQRDWLIELVSLRTTRAVKDSTHEFDLRPGVTMYSHLLTSDAADPRNTEEYEMVTAIGKIAEKAFTDGKPTKFPEPNDAIQCVVVDARGYLGSGGGDFIDYVQMAAGAGCLQGTDQMFAKRVPGTRTRVRGLFEPSNPLEAARLFRERVHFVGFVAEKQYIEGELTQQTFLVNNMNLLPSAPAIEAAQMTFPLPGARLMRVVRR